MAIPGSGRRKPKLIKMTAENKKAQTNLSPISHAPKFFCTAITAASSFLEAIYPPPPLKKARKIQKFYHHQPATE
jgi:hypothetical protein